MKKKISLVLAVLILGLFSLSYAFALAEFKVTAFSCSPSEVAVNSQFSCTATISNTGDASGSVSVATLYPDSGEWLESLNYPQASGTSVGAGQSTTVIFSGLKAIKSGNNNGFSKITLDSVTDTYVTDVKVNTIDVAVVTTKSTSSAAMGGTFTTTAEVTAGGDIDVLLSFGVNSGGCVLSDGQSDQVTISGMTHGNKQSREWTVTQGTSGACSYTLSAAATGSGGKATKIDSVDNSVSCSDCPVSGGDSPGSAGPGGDSSGGGEATARNIGELVGVLEKDFYLGTRLLFNFSSQEHSIGLISLTDKSALLSVKSKEQKVILNVGEESQIDLNADGVNDINIKLKSINTLTKKASLVITRLGDVVSSGGVGNSGTLNPTTGNVAAVGNENGVINLGSISKLWVYVLVGIILVVIIVIIVVVIASKKRKKYPF